MEVTRVAELKKEVGKSLTKNDVASVVDWMNVSNSEDDWTIHEGDMYETHYDLPRGWKCIWKEDKDGNAFIPTLSLLSLSEDARTCLSLTAIFASGRRNIRRRLSANIASKHHVAWKPAWVIY